jgi:hypothetical protein
MNRSAVSIVFIFLFAAATVFASGNGKVFTDDDLQQYSSPSEQGSKTYENSSGKSSRGSDSPLESDLRRRKDEVARENIDYIEKQYEWMKNDCLKYTGEMKKDCLFRTEAWHKDELRQVDKLKKYLER